MHRAPILSLAWLLLFTAACGPIASISPVLQLAGSGNLVTQDFRFDKADRLLAASNFKVTASPGEKVTVKVTADDNVMPYIYVHASNGELRLEMKPGHSYDMNKVTQKAEVTMPALAAVVAQDNAAIQLGEHRASELALRLRDNGTVTGNGISSARISLTSDGNGQARLSGAAAELKLDARGNTIVACRELQVHAARVMLQENAMATLQVTDRLDYNLSGNSGLVYSGSPQLGRQERGENATVHRE